MAPAPSQPGIINKVEGTKGMDIKDWSYFTRDYDGSDITHGAILVKLSGWGFACGPVGIEHLHLLKDISEFPLLHEALTEAEVADSDEAAANHYSMLADEGLIDMDASDLDQELVNFLEKQRQRCVDAGDDYSKLVQISKDYNLFMKAETVMLLTDFLKISSNQAILKTSLDQKFDHSISIFKLVLPGDEDGVTTAINVQNEFSF